MWDFEPVPYKRCFSVNYMNYKIALTDIETIITLFFPEKSATISQELFADNNALLNKLLKYFRPYKFFS